jgi:hypothetical protein
MKKFLAACVITIIVGGSGYLAFYEFGKAPHEKIVHVSESFRKSFDGYNMVGYSESPVGATHILGGGYHEETNELRGIRGNDSQVGLFRPNRDIYFWIFDSHGRPIHQAKFHLNNYGLESIYDDKVEKQSDEFRIVVLGQEQTAATTASVSWPDYLQQLIDKTKFHIAGKNRVTVINFGHLDTGYPQYEYILKHRALAFKPDLILINTIFFDFDRTFPAVTPKPNYLYVAIKALDGEKVVSVFPCVGGVVSYDNPNCQPSKAIPMWLPYKVAHDPKALLSARDQFIRIAYEISQKKMGQPPSIPRPSKTPTPQEIQAQREQHDKELVDKAARHLESIISEGVPTVIIQNPFGPASLFGEPGDTYRLTRLIERYHPSLHYIDMRSYLPSASTETKRSWFVAISSEKWSDAGHRAYAEAVLRVLSVYADDLAKGKASSLLSH